MTLTINCPFFVKCDVIWGLKSVMQFKCRVAFTQVEFEAVAPFAEAGSARHCLQLCSWSGSLPCPGRLNKTCISSVQHIYVAQWKVKQFLIPK